MIDLITIVFRDELPILRVQAESIYKYCSSDFVGNIYVVVNDDLDDSVIDPSWWGDFANQVQILNRSQFGSDWTSNGWVSQQALKLLCGAQCENKWSVVLDAKTLIVKSLDSTLFDHNQRAKSGSLQIYDVFLPSKHIVDQLFDVDLSFQLGPGGVPFIFSTDTVKQLVHTIEESTCQDFASWFQSQGMLTEFLLYTGYAIKSGHIDKYSLAESSIHPVNICHSETGIWDTKIDQMKNNNTLTVSVHRGAWASASEQQKQAYRDLLISKHLLQSSEI